MSEYGLIWAISANPSGKPCAFRGKTLIQPRVGPVAQWLEPAAHNRLVGGSSPSGPTITFDFIDKKCPRPKTFWAHYGPKAKTVVPVCSDSIWLFDNAEVCPPLHVVAFGLALVDGTSNINRDPLLIGLADILIRHGH